MFRQYFANASLKVVSVVIAVVLWVVVLQSRNDEALIDVKVEVITPADLVVANDVPENVVFKLSGPKAFLRNIRERKIDPIRVNLATSKPGLHTYRVLSDQIEVPIGVKVLAITPSTIMLKLEPVKHKDVPVRLVTRGEVPAGYKMTRLELVEPTIHIKGPESRVDQIGEAPTGPIDLAQMRESGERQVPLDLSKLTGVVIDGPLPKVQHEVMQSTANFKIRNADIKVLTNRQFTVDPKEVVLYVRCSPDELQNLDRSKVYAVADLRTKGAGTYQPTLSVQLPSNIKLIKVLPSKVKVVLQ